MAMPSETTSWDTSNTNVVEPSGTKKALGWVVDEKPASGYLNWLFVTIEAWLVWLSGIYGYASAWSNTATWTATSSTPLLEANNTGSGAAWSILNQSSTAATMYLENAGTYSGLIVTVATGDGIDVTCSAGIGVNVLCSGGGVGGQFSNTGSGDCLHANAGGGTGLALQVTGNASRAGLHLNTYATVGGLPPGVEGDIAYVAGTTHNLYFFNGTSWTAV
jgi:hypothetical protein